MAVAILIGLVIGGHSALASLRCLLTRTVGARGSAASLGSSGTLLILLVATLLWVIALLIVILSSIWGIIRVSLRRGTVGGTVGLLGGVPTLLGRVPLSSWLLVHKCFDFAFGVSNLPIAALKAHVAGGCVGDRFRVSCHLDSTARIAL